MGFHNIADYNKTLSPEQRRESALRASRASAEKRRAARTWKEAAQQAMRGNLTPEEDRKTRAVLGLGNDVDLNQRDAIIAAMTAKAKAGDHQAAAFLRDTAGEKPELLLKVGTIEDKPFDQIDLRTLTDAELRQLAERERGEVIDLEPVSDNDCGTGVVQIVDVEPEPIDIKGLPE